MTLENSLGPNQKQLKDGQENEEVDYAEIVKRTLDHSFVPSKPGTTLANLGVVSAGNLEVVSEETGAGSTVQDDNKLIDLEADLVKKRHEAKIERNRTGKHIVIKQG